MNGCGVSRIVTRRGIVFDRAKAESRLKSAPSRLQAKRGNMPSLIRFLFVLGVLAGLVYAGMWALVFYVEPTPREMSVRIPADRINPDN